MEYNFFSSIHFEDWDWTNLEQGIGGSETHHIEMVWRLARRGAKVMSYCPTPFQGEKKHKDVIWSHFDNADFTRKGVWVIYRCPEILDNFEKEHPDQEIWMVMQDEAYSGWTPERIAKVDKVLALCEKHKNYTLENTPELKGKVFVASNGVNMESIREVEELGIERNPKKLIYASSPDRGLKSLLKIFKRAKEFVPELELHCFYGFNNIDKLSKRFPTFKKQKDELIKMMSQPGVTWHGRVSQKELHREWASAGIWCYPTNFTETSCITCMEAQALGAIPITNPLWALGENVMNGIFLPGDAWNDKLIQAKYTAEIVRLALNPELQQQIRIKMMWDAQYRFNWERQVDQFERWIYRMPNANCNTQYCFQHKHLKGRVLNVGCDIDFSNLSGRGAINVDIVPESPILKHQNRQDFIADARKLPALFHNQFDTVILGDILEHMTDSDIIKSLTSAKKCLKDDGIVIVTIPDDPRTDMHQQHKKIVDNYTKNIPAYHTRPISVQHIHDLIKKSGLKVNLSEIIDYTHFLGNGIIATK